MDIGATPGAGPGDGRTPVLDPIATMSAAEVTAILDLKPLPVEGGMFRQTFVDAYSTAIYYLLVEGDFSALHRLAATEVYHWYAGAPVRIVVLDADSGRCEEHLIGPDIAAGQRPQFVVRSGVWQGSSSTGPWSLVGTTMAPGYTEAGFVIGERAELCARFPEWTDRINALTRAAESLQ